MLIFVLHRQNQDKVAEILDLAAALEADYVELAATQYYGWAMLNRDALMPTREQVTKAETVAHEYQKKMQGKMKIYYRCSHIKFPNHLSQDCFISGLAMLLSEII